MAFIVQRPVVDHKALEFWSTRTVWILLAHNFWQLIHHAFLPFLNLPIFPCLAVVAFFKASQPGAIDWEPMKFMAFITNAIALLREVHFVTGAFAHFATLTSNYKPIQNLLDSLHGESTARLLGKNRTNYDSMADETSSILDRSILDGVIMSANNTERGPDPKH